VHFSRGRHLGWRGNFALFSAHATPRSGSAQLFDDKGARRHRIELPEHTDQIWHGYLAIRLAQSMGPPSWTITSGTRSSFQPQQICSTLTLAHLQGHVFFGTRLQTPWSQSSELLNEILMVLRDQNRSFQSRTDQNRKEG